MKIYIFFAAFFLNIITFYAQPNIIFRSGFEPNTEIIEYTYHLDKIIGEDISYLPPNNWLSNFSFHPYINFGHINYGHDNQNQSIRKAVIKPDPDANYPDNNAMHFWILEPYNNGGEVKGRVQVNLDGNEASKFSYSVRLFLPSDLAPLKNINYSFSWFTLMEFWNNFSNPYKFRIKLELVKDSGTDKMRFKVAAQRHITAGWVPMWSNTNSTYEVPLEKWMSFQVYVEEGDASNGRFKIILTPDGENPIDLFDITNYTHHPNNPVPEGFEHIQPMKLYTSEGLINYVNANNGFVNIYWDDFVLCDDEGLDLQVRNSSSDNGSEPDNVSPFFWVSPDIWIRNYDDDGQTHQNPLYNLNPNYVHVRVNNKSCRPTSGEETLELYWAKADTGLGGAALWTGTATGGSNNIPLGGQIGVLTIPVIEPGQDVVIKFPWQVPNPLDFTEITDNDWHFCLLTRIVAPNDPMAYPNLPWSAKWNNNIAAKNVTVISLIQSDPNLQPGGAVSIGNLSGETEETFDFHFFSNELDSAIFDEAEVLITLNPDAFNRWMSGGSLSDNIEVYNEEEGELLITGNHARLLNMQYGPDEWDILYLSFNFLTEEVTAKEVFEYYVVQKDTEGAAIGGEVYQIIRDPERQHFVAAGDSYENTYGETEMIATDIGEPAVYNWYAPDGQLIYSGKDFTFIPEVTGDYLLEVIAVTDGHKDYSQLTIAVNVTQDQIVNLAPNPASGIVEVIYQISPNATNASLNVISFFGTSNTNYPIDLNNTENTLDINLSSYPTGYYGVILIVDGQAVHARQLIVK